MATRKQTTTKRADAPLKHCAYCNGQHQRRGIYCSDNCKLKAFRARQKEVGGNVSETVSYAENIIPFPPSQDVLSVLNKLVELQQRQAEYQEKQTVLLEKIASLQPVSAPPPPPKQTIKMTIPDDVDVEIETKKVEGGGLQTVNNYLNSLFAMTGQSGVVVAPAEPERTIKINNEDMPAQGIKRMEVPQFAVPSFDDDDIEL